MGLKKGKLSWKNSSFLRELPGLNVCSVIRVIVRFYVVSDREEEEVDLSLVLP